MFYVWTNWKDKSKRLRVAGTDNFDEAIHYAHMYTSEGEVTVRYKNKHVIHFMQGNDVNEATD